MARKGRALVGAESQREGLPVEQRRDARAPDERRFVPGLLQPALVGLLPAGLEQDAAEREHTYQADRGVHREQPDTLARPVTTESIDESIGSRPLGEAPTSAQPGAR